MLYLIFLGDDGIYYGIEDNTGALVYDADMLENEARAIARAHNLGAESYEDAMAMIYAAFISPKE